jgi:hypothetical protein
LQEDGIISAQKDGNDEVAEYEHNHVFRAGFNGNYGTKLTTNGIVAPQQKYTTSFTLAFGTGFLYGHIPVNINNCSVVAYLLDMVTKEVLQVEEVAVSGER